MPSNPSTARVAMLEEGVDYIAFIDEPSHKPPWVSGELVRIEQWFDFKGNDDMLAMDTNGTRVVIDKRLTYR